MLVAPNCRADRTVAAVALARPAQDDDDEEPASPRKLAAAPRLARQGSSGGNTKANSAPATESMLIAKSARLT